MDKNPFVNCENNISMQIVAGKDGVINTGVVDGWEQLFIESVKDKYN